MPRFVILRHETPPGDARPSHWDWMFEQGGSLATWAVERAPTQGERTPARALPPHRLAYLTYEGPLSGGRGTVSQIDAGEYLGAIHPTKTTTLQLRGGAWNGELTIQPPREIESTDLDSSTWSFSWRASPSDDEVGAS